MGIKLEEYDKVCVMEVDGDLSGENARMAATMLREKSEERKVVDFLIDLGKCSFIDSEGLETLLAMKRRCEDLFGQIKLARVDENCRTILQMTRLDHRFESYHDLSAALKTMR
jgi:anti-anti-sigma factor